MATIRELDDAVVAACQSVARQLRELPVVRDREMDAVVTTVWLACDCLQNTTCSLVNIGSVMICQDGHGQQRVIDVIE